MVGDKYLFAFAEGVFSLVSVTTRDSQELFQEVVLLEGCDSSFTLHLIADLYSYIQRNTTHQPPFNWTAYHVK